MRPHTFVVTLMLACLLAPLAYAQDRMQDFSNPTIRDFRLDFCRNFGANCGQPAADLFCQELGFDAAAFWLPAGPVDGQTLIFGDGRLCTGPGCLAFSLIRCFAATVPAAPPPPPIVPPADPVAAPPAPIVPEVGPAAVPIPEPPVATPVPRPAFAEPPATLIEIVPFAIAGFNPLAVAIDRLVFLDERGAYPEGAALFSCSSGDCSLAHSADREVKPDGVDRTVDFNWNVSRVPYAGGVLIQVSHQPFPPFGNLSDTDFDPVGLVFSGRSDGATGFFELDLDVLAEQLPAGTGGATFHVRILPVSSVALGSVVGQPSNVMRVFFGEPLPEREPFRFFDPEIVADAPLVELVAIEFRPHRFVDMPAGCINWEAYRQQQQRNFFERVGDAFKSMWDFTAEAYQWSKNRVLDLAAAITFNAIPDEVLSFALDAALASVGIPPDIPNLDELISGGIGQLAAKMAEVAVAQIPSADLAVSLGNIAADITVDVALDMAEDELRERLRDELERKSREALILAADEIEQAASTPQVNEPCSSTFIPASYRVTVQNVGPDHLADIRVAIGDSESVFWEVAVDVDLAPGQEISFMAVPEPRIIDVWDNRLVRMEPMASNDNASHWWNEILYQLPTIIRVELPGHRECLGNCVDAIREVFGSPPQLMTEGFVAP